MKFEDQSPEMQQTLIFASVGEATIEAHAFEHILRIIFCMAKSKTDVEFENEFNKKRTLGQLLSDEICKNIFAEEEITVLNTAKNTRNEFTHQLSNFYISNINSGASMYSLIEDFRSIKLTFESATNICLRHMENMAERHGVDIDAFKEIAAERIGVWAHA